MAIERKSTTNQDRGSSQKRQRKMSEYGRQLAEKQKVKELYGLRERQFRRFFGIAAKSERASGRILLSMLERRLDNVLYRLKLASTRPQSRQMIVHGHVLLNGRKVYSPSYQVNVDDVVEIAPISAKKDNFVSQVVDKRLSKAAKVPEWLELDKNARKGKVLRYPVREDIQTPIEETLIVELYSK
jgi:small subunit ribosomal protein S4